MYRVVQAEVALVEVAAAEGPAQMDRLSHRYTGGPYQFPMSRELVRIELAPTRVLSSLDP